MTVISPLACVDPVVQTVRLVTTNRTVVSLFTVGLGSFDSIQVNLV